MVKVSQKAHEKTSVDMSQTLFFTFLSKSTYYGKYPGGGSCALDPPSPLNKQPGWIMVAAGRDDYQMSLGCGMCVEITATGEQTDPSTGGPTPMKGTYKALRC